MFQARSHQENRRKLLISNLYLLGKIHIVRFYANYYLRPQLFRFLSKHNKQWYVSQTLVLAFNLANFKINMS